MNPIATYREQRPDGWRLHRLHHDNLEVVGKNYFGSEFELVFPPRQLEPIVEKVRARAGNFWFDVVSCAAFTAIPGGIAMYLAAGSGYKYLALTAALAGSLGLYNMTVGRRIEFICVQSTNGVRVLYVGRAGSEKHMLDEFVEALIAQIKVVKATKCTTNEMGS